MCSFLGIVLQIYRQASEDAFIECMQGPLILLQTSKALQAFHMQEIYIQPQHPPCYSLMHTLVAAPSEAEGHPAFCSMHTITCG